MNGRDASDSAHQERLVEAARWRVVLTELGVESTPEFDAWLDRPGNAVCWAQVSTPWDFLGEQAGAPELVAIRQAALGDAKGADGKARFNGRRILAEIAAVLVLGLIAWGSIVWFERPDDYSTGQGERRVITLADGSRVALDSNSEVTVRYTQSARLLKLLHGQARFDVTHDVERPFSVLAGEQKVIATGTAFNIDLNGSRVLVTLIEGHVVVVDEDSAPHVANTALAVRRQAVELRAGQQLSASPQKSPNVEPANIQRVTAWMNGQLMFDNESLGQVVARVNRYTTTPIEIHDPKVAAMRISGVFNTGDVAGVVSIVTQYLPVRAVNEDNGAIALESETKG